jgi:integrase
MAIFEATAKHHRVGVGLALFAGLRAGEILGLRWRDVELERGRLIVRESVSHGIRTTPKSGHEREVPLTKEMLALLQSEHQRLNPKAEDAVVLTRGDRVAHGPSIRKAFKRAVRKVGLDPQHWRLHDCRHFFVTELFRLGVGGPTVQRLAGHSNLATTQIYAHVAGVDLEAAIERLGGGHHVVTPRKAG